MILKSNILAQLSPGDLATPHAHLEGLLNCTRCHTLGQGIEEGKCLDCHAELKNRIEARRGFHISEGVERQSCISCHSDHHGRNFEIVHLDELNFDHAFTGYELEEAHNEIDCRECHQLQFIKDDQVKDKEFTYLGLDTDCISCHTDPHQKTLSTNCSECHSFKAFAPADYFDHNETSFPLVGQHLNVECLECHSMERRNGDEFQIFAGLEYASCTSCHEDVHNGTFGQNCTECHSEESFQNFVGKNQFNHNITRFTLKGQHQQIDCYSCHMESASGNNPFQEYTNLGDFSCISCHEDVHENKFGNDCAQCHSEQSFTSLPVSSNFDHNLTDFALEGKHLKVDCRECHQISFVEAIPFNKCATCHEDYHQGQFSNSLVIDDCKDCHVVAGFEEPTFTVEQHHQSSFPLTGAHLAIPCLECHLQEDKWMFRDIGERCIDCHEDIHENVIATEFYPGQECINCHVTDSWTMVSFDHEQTNFPLKGKHQEITCYACHLLEVDSLYQQFAELPGECIHCHEDVHSGQFEEGGQIDCNRCHTFQDWASIIFDHDHSAFPLEGEHVNVECSACHKETNYEKENYVIYKIESFECADCHL